MADEHLAEQFLVIFRIASGNRQARVKLVTLGGGGHGIVFCKYMRMTDIVTCDSLELLD